MRGAPGGRQAQASEAGETTFPTPDVELHHGDVRDVLEGFPESHFHGILTDPPYGLGTAPWDGEVPGARVWRRAFRVLAPGHWLLAFGGRRTHHRLMLHLEEGGFELRDLALWLYGTGMPHGETTLRPAFEPLVLARVPGPAVPLAIDRCRTRGEVLPADRRTSPRGSKTAWGTRGEVRDGERHHPEGRWPTNVLLGHDRACTAESCTPDCPQALLEAQRPGATRFFYAPKPAGREAAGNPHPTKKPVRLTSYLARLIRPAEGGRLLVLFSGSGSEILGALGAGWGEVVGVELEERWVELTRRRLARALGLSG